MNILVISPLIPWPLDQGGKIRLFNIIKGLADNHRITLAVIVEDSIHAELGVLEKLCDEVIVVDRPARLWTDRLLFALSGRPYNIVRYRSQRFQQVLLNLLSVKAFDLVQIEFSMMWSYAEIFRKRGIPVVLDAHNIEYHNICDIGRDMSSFLWQQVYRVEERRLRKLEQRAWRECTACIAVSERERQEIAACTGRSDRVIAAVNGVDPERFVFRRRSGRDNDHQGRLLFLGGMDYLPNLDAIHYFLQEIFPRIRQLNAHIRLDIVGRELWKINRRFETNTEFDGVSFHENVTDVLPWFYESDVLVVPLRQGAGTRIKILEAMAAGLPVVSTSKGCEGTAVVSGKHVMIADTPEQFAKSVVEVSAYPAKLQMLAANAHQLVMERYTWQRAVAAIDACYAQIQKGCGEHG